VAGVGGNDEWQLITCWRSGTNTYLGVNGVVHVTTAISNAAGSLTNTNGSRAIWVGNSVGVATSMSGAAMSLLRICKGALSKEKIRKMFNAERGMFQANAKCFLQDSSPAVLDVSVDKISGRYAITQANKASVYDGCLIVDEISVPSGGTTFEHVKLHGNDQFIVTDANMYASVAAKNLRGSLDVVRKLASPNLGPDLGKAKCWVKYDFGASTIRASYNVKSISNGSGRVEVVFGVPFKSENYTGFAAVEFGDRISGTTTTIETDPDTNLFTFPPGRDRAHVHFGNAGGSSTNIAQDVYLVFFGELENE
jgi:hypothetical protein